eukprot:UN31789
MSQAHAGEIENDQEMETRIYFRVPQYTVREDHKGPLEIKVTRKGNLEQIHSVDWETTNGTAVAGSDYEHGVGKLVFSPGQTEATIEVTILEDQTVEPNEFFCVLLSNLGPGSKV